MQHAITFKVNHEIYKMIHDEAAKMGLSPGQYARFAALQSINLNLVISNQEAAAEKMDTLLDRDTMKGVLEYLNTHMPKLIYDYFQAQRAQRT